MRHFSDVTRFVYNWALGKRKAAYEADEPMPKSGDLIKEFRANRPEWTQGACSRCEESALKSLDAAYDRFFRICRGELPKPPPSHRQDGPPGFPRFHSRHRGTTPFAFWSIKTRHVEASRVRLQGLGWVRLKEQGYLPVEGAKLNRATVSERAGRWFVSLQVEEETEEAKPRRNRAIGVDRGITKLVACSDGTEYSNPKALQKMERRLRRLQRKLTRQHCVVTSEKAFEGRRLGGFSPAACNLKRKGDAMSAGALKTKARVARLHYRITCARSDAAHQATHRIIEHKRPATVVLEDLNVAGMLKNGRLAKSISDAAMSEVGRQLKYKAEWNGTEVVEADRWFASTKTCPACGHKNDFGLGARRPVCTECGYTGDRDLDWAAINLEALAGKPPESLNASGGEGSGLTAQAAG